jgi:hypothetical protein
MRQILNLLGTAPIRALYAKERKTDLPEAFCNARARLSREAWDRFSVGCDSGPIAKTGVAWQPISQEWADRLFAILDQSEPAVLRRGDYPDGYMATLPPEIVHYLNVVNDYRTVTPVVLTAWREFLGAYGPDITRLIGHPWRVCSARQFNLRPITEPGSRHIDGWPPAIRKIFILPRGASVKWGTTWFRLRDGNELVFDNPTPCLVVFENNVVEHSMMPGPAYRPTIELDIVPARETSIEPVYAGLNGWYPWFPEKSGRWHLLAAMRRA